MRGIEVNLAEYGVPTRYIEFSEFLPGHEWLAKFAKPKARGLYLRGASGVGKTVAAVLVARQWLWDRAETKAITVPSAKGEWRFISCAKMVMQLQDAWRSDQSAFQYLDRLAQVPHLILDDLGTEKATEYVRQSIYYLLNEREAWNRQTIITSNYPLDEIDEQYDPRISSRILGMCENRAMGGKDLRVERA